MLVECLCHRSLRIAIVFRYIPFCDASHSTIPPPSRVANIGTLHADHDGRTYTLFYVCSYSTSTPASVLNRCRPATVFEYYANGIISYRRIDIIFHSYCQCRFGWAKPSHLTLSNLDACPNLHMHTQTNTQRHRLHIHIILIMLLFVLATRFIIMMMMTAWKQSQNFHSIFSVSSRGVPDRRSVTYENINCRSMATMIEERDEKKDSHIAHVVHQLHFELYLCYSQTKHSLTRRIII